MSERAQSLLPEPGRLAYAVRCSRNPAAVEKNPTNTQPAEAAGCISGEAGRLMRSGMQPPSSRRLLQASILATGDVRPMQAAVGNPEESERER